MELYPDRLFKRTCVSCPSDGPQCPKCPSGKVCTFSVQTCEKCPVAQCVSDGLSSGSRSGISSHTAGAIAGGVVGGLVGLSLILGILLWYKFRHRRRRHLQSMKEMELENDSPADYPMEESHNLDGRPASITSTYGLASHRSNVIPIVLPFNGGQSTPSVGAFSRPHTTYSNGGFSRSAFASNEGFEPALRDSIGFSELSIDSDSASTNTRGLRSYDVAVQGIPSLVDLNKARRIQIQQPQLGVISENEALSGSGSASEPPAPSSPQSRVTSSRRRSVMSMRSMRDADAALPELPSVESSAVSCFDDSAAIEDENLPRSRYSIASSNEYIANLPEEAKVFVDHKSFQ